MGNEVEEIKARVDVVDLISEYVKLKQLGTNWKGLCPFHAEKTPSFMASRDKQIWHCFGCGEGGDIFSFIQKVEGVEFAESLRLLAQRAGVKLERGGKEYNASQRNRLLDITNLAAKFWHKILLDSQAGQVAREYIEKRGLTQKTVEEFQIGFAPDSWEVLNAFLKKRGYSDQEIFLSGLSIKKEGTARFYDRFRSRVMFPINDLHGNVIGFSGRIIAGDETQAKYINTPQTELYNKSVVLFNLDRAKLAIKKQNLAILVEGQMDVVTAWQAGFQNVIAASGTALTLEQVTIIKRYADTIAIAFDTDSAGQAAALRGIDIALQQDLNVKVITLPAGKDPDECIRNNPADFTQAIAEARSIMDHYFTLAQKQFDVTDATGKKQIAKLILPVIQKIGNQIEQTHWLQKLATLLNVSEAILRESIAPVNARRRVIDQPVAAIPVKAVGRWEALSDRVLALWLGWPELLSGTVEDFNPDLLVGQERKALYKDLIVYYNQLNAQASNRFDFEQFLLVLANDQLRQQAQRLILLAEDQFGEATSTARQVDLTSLLGQLHRTALQQQLQAVTEEIRAAERAGDSEQLIKLSEQCNDIFNQLKLFV